MCKLCIFIGMMGLGWVGWWLGAKIGFLSAFLISGVGSMTGIYLGWRVYRDFIE